MVSVSRAQGSGVSDTNVRHLVLNLVANRSRFGSLHWWKKSLAMSWWRDHSVGRICPALDRLSAITFILPGRNGDIECDHTSEQ